MRIRSKIGMLFVLMSPVLLFSLFTATDMTESSKWKSTTASTVTLPGIETSYNEKNMTTLTVVRTIPRRKRSAQEFCSNHNDRKASDDLLRSDRERSQPDRRFSSSSYWEARYKNGGNSGAGSYGKLADFKAQIINDIVRANAVRSVTEFGVGDGNQLRLASYPRYIGVDVSPTILQKAKTQWSQDPSKQFFIATPGNVSLVSSEMTLSLDVIYHLIELPVFQQYMDDLFKAAERFVVIYAFDRTERIAPHVLYRKFTDYINIRFPCWKLMKMIPNPWKGSGGADFYVYERSTSDE